MRKKSESEEVWSGPKPPPVDSCFLGVVSHPVRVSFQVLPSLCTVCLLLLLLCPSSPGQMLTAMMLLVNASSSGSLDPHLDTNLQPLAIPVFFGKLYFFSGLGFSTIKWK